MKSATTFAGMEITEMLLDDMSQHPENANNGDMEALRESIEVNGFYSPVIVQASTGFIIAGNHRYAVARSLGFVTLPAIVLDVTDEQARRMMLADNRITRLGRDDPAQLAEVLESLSETDYGLMGTGFSHAELQTLLDSLDKPLQFEDEPGEEGDVSSQLDGKYIVTPVADLETGECAYIAITRQDDLALMPTDLNAIRESLGMKRVTTGQIDQYDIDGWV